MTSQGSAHGRFQRAIQRRNLFQAELAMRELGTLSLLDALACLELLHELGSAKLERAPVLRWHGRLARESSVLTLGESQLALAAISRACGPANATRSRSCTAFSRRAKPTLLLRLS